ncbi:DUF6076 domain-containing protein [Anaerovirgula multivorans]|uniref:DUF6076 domain-containing protein n=1 Tax=Anaerovirgula multivorans TaxID=312168 RepID=UPI0038B99DF4
MSETSINSYSSGAAFAYYLIEYLDEMLFFEFTEMLKNRQYVKRCKLCGRYFVLTDKRKRDFCDRPYTGKRTCKQVGRSCSLKKASKPTRFYSNISPSTTRSIPAGQARHDYVAGRISGEEMLTRVRLN